jgi:phage protein D
MPADQNTTPSAIGAFYEIRLDGQRLDPVYDNAVRSVIVEDAVNRPAMFRINMSFQAADTGLDQLGRDFFDTFAPGAEIEISMGRTTRTPLFAGKITAIAPTFANPPHVEIRGYDRMYELRFGRKRRAYSRIKDSALVERVAGAAGISVQAEDTGVLHDYVFQNNQTDYEFLIERAERIDYELRVEDRTLQFKPPAETAAPEATLTYEVDLNRIALEIRTLTEGSEIELRGWDQSRKQSVSARAQSGDEAVQPETGGQSGYQLSRAAFRASAAAVINESLGDAVEAQRVAKAQYRKSLREFITGDGECPGEPRIRAGRTVELAGLGGPLNGVYYVVGSTHEYSDSVGYMTRFMIRRTFL